MFVYLGNHFLKQVKWFEENWIKETNCLYSQNGFSLYSQRLLGFAISIQNAKTFENPTRSIACLRYLRESYNKQTLNAIHKGPENGHIKYAHTKYSLKPIGSGNQIKITLFFSGRSQCGLPLKGLMTEIRLATICNNVPVGLRTNEPNGKMFFDGVFFQFVNGNTGEHGMIRWCSISPNNIK